MKLLVKRVWHSPVMMSWANLGVKSSALFLLLPLVVGTLPASDSVIWFAVATLFTLQLVVDFGLTPTITRYISYVYGGTALSNLVGGRSIAVDGKSGDPNWPGIAQLYVNLKMLYRVVALAMLSVGVLLTLFLLGPAITKSTQPGLAGIAVAFAIFVASVNVFGNSYVSLLQGCGGMAFVQRVQMLFASINILLGAGALLFSGSVAIAIIAFYAPNLACVMTLRHASRKRLAHVEADGTRPDEEGGHVAATIRRQMAGDAARSGMGVLASLGVVQVSGLVVARIMIAEQAAAYMLGLQMIRAASSFSQAPFYAHLPYMATLYSDPKQHDKLLKVAGVGMIRSLTVFLLFVLFIGAALSSAGHLFGNRQLPSLALWGTMGLAFLMERFGAMQLQLYTIAGDVIWHRANGFAALVILLTAPVLFQYMGTTGLALAMLLGYGLVYAPYCTFKARSAFALRLLRPALLILAGIMVCILFIYIGSYAGKN